MKNSLETKYFSKENYIGTYIYYAIILSEKKDHLLFMDQVSTFVIEYIECFNNNIMSNYVNVF